MVKEVRMVELQQTVQDDKSSTNFYHPLVRSSNISSPALSFGEIQSFELLLNDDREDENLRKSSYPSCSSTRSLLKMNATEWN